MMLAKFAKGVQGSRRATAENRKGWQVIIDNKLDGFEDMTLAQLRTMYHGFIVIGADCGNLSLASSSDKFTTDEDGTVRFI